MDKHNVRTRGVFRRCGSSSPGTRTEPAAPPALQNRRSELESGETIKDFSISYVTHGTLNAKKSNAILMVTAISGNHHRIDFMIGPGKALDTDKYFIVCTDAIGNGLTTRPATRRPAAHVVSEVPDPRHGPFAVQAADRKFGIEHLVAVIGPSMGGMQTLQWGVSHPDMMDSLVAMVPLTALPLGPLRCWSRRARRSCSIRLGTAATTPAAREGHSPVARHPQPPLCTHARITTTSSPTRSTLPYMAQETGLMKAFDANDWIYQTWAYELHDVGTTPGFNGDMVKALRSIKAKTLILRGPRTS